ncbi:hypothetical protein FB45DRAFT_1051163 [Roridomyces roridus]|uniref:NADH:flavin oxidoreductase/NADH oxidase N-terminal domain-containing protein n=1 Tax=Roridomyces roridus TaxID=1738132 RepID=A0AAD7CDR9_9AGAR|nr:hypothetical protein FB45DRAFT_1051163 [Roridomyces roridus]
MPRGPSYIYLQLWALGRAAEPAVLRKGCLSYLLPTSLPARLKLLVHSPSKKSKNTSSSTPPPLPTQSIRLTLTASRFTAPTDTHSSFIENRVRFVEVVDAVVSAVGQKKTAFRISPWGTYLDIHFDDPKPTDTHLVTELRDRYPDLAYLHVVEPRVDGSTTFVKDGYSNDFIRDFWAPARS